MAANSTLFDFFNAYPIFPVTNLLIGAAAFLPLCCLLYIAQITPLHSNCRYILCMWALSFGSVFVVTILVAIVDLKNESGYMPLSEFTNELGGVYPYIGLALLALIEVFVLATGSFVLRVSQKRYDSSYGKTSLTVKEACEMSRAMIPAYATSFTPKASTIIVISFFFTVRAEHENILGYVEAYYSLKNQTCAHVERFLGQIGYRNLF
ncbi:hypothetical protein PRIPAC_80086 [Pristionchus pacificus]|uniref:Uncharacterized protein n=1 Tax=Pristionchus pacificus TaxID=54126 RepID=A0A2A6CNB7_PRIPA|nr:hypothetical protein PRIPAC_80086 [Pristionchus pacificus]|eukprot:PDM79692.1 hypothetical protein PRIPAC_32271 [Pristionchus pacificus]